jgi:two-component system sensor histidine kinase ChvG
MKSLSFRLLLFNILLLFLPLGSLLYLDTYENQLLSSQENSMIQQGRLLASGLGGLAGPGELAAEARRVLTNLSGRVDSRIRVVDAEGRLLADSATILGIPPEPPPAPTHSKAANNEAGNDDADDSPNASILYRAVVYPVNLLKRLLFPPQVSYEGAEFYSGQQILLGPEIRSALEGRYGAATRFSSGGQVSVNLYSAIPVFTAGEVIGAVLVSRSTYGILLNIYRLRLDIIRIFLVSLAFSLVLSLALSLTITRPIIKLKAEAEQVLDKAGHFSGHFRGLKRRDEIGDLSRSLSGLSLKLEKRIGFIDAFTSDLLHELKNPLASIRGQVELALASPEKEEKLLQAIGQEETRMERLLARLRELSRIDNSLEGEETEDLDLAKFIPLLLERYGANVSFLNRAGSSAMVKIKADRLIQALTNPLDNAVSFSPADGEITITLQQEDNAPRWLITIDDNGPGIREESGGRYFERFYSERPDNDREGHSGLGLAIVKAIAEGYGGRCSLSNRQDAEGRVTGCRFSLTLGKTQPR